MLGPELPLDKGDDGGAQELMLLTLPPEILLQILTFVPPPLRVDCFSTCTFLYGVQEGGREEPRGGGEMDKRWRGGGEVAWWRGGVVERWWRVGGELVEGWQRSHSLI
jgi:hypothetical protein